MEEQILHSSLSENEGQSDLCQGGRQQEDPHKQKDREGHNKEETQERHLQTEGESQGSGNLKVQRRD